MSETRPREKSANNTGSRYDPKASRTILSAKDNRHWFRGSRPVLVDGEKRWLEWRKFKRIFKP